MNTYALIIPLSYNYFIMSAKIDIEYCGAWGFGGPANRVKAAIKNAFPDVQIDCHSASGKTGVVKISWIQDGKLETIWNKGKQPTEDGHA
jgi:selT/selW/selH-like putative selenoprotein